MVVTGDATIITSTRTGETDTTTVIIRTTDSRDAAEDTMTSTGGMRRPHGAANVKEQEVKEFGDQSVTRRDLMPGHVHT